LCGAVIDFHRLVSSLVNATQLPPAAAPSRSSSSRRRSSSLRRPSISRTGPGRAGLGRSLLGWLTQRAPAAAAPGLGGPTTPTNDVDDAIALTSVASRGARAPEDAVGYGAPSCRLTAESFSLCQLLAPRPSESVSAAAAAADSERFSAS